MAKKRSKKLREADAFRARVMALRSLSDTDWSDWEADWLDSEARRHPDYIFTDKERIILNQLIASTATFSDYNAWTIPEMIRIARGYFADLLEGDDEFVFDLWQRSVTNLRVRQINRLAVICSNFEPIGRDERVEGALREMRRKDDELYYEPSPDIPFPQAA